MNSGKNNGSKRIHLIHLKRAPPNSTIPLWNNSIELFHRGIVDESDYSTLKLFFVGVLRSYFFGADFPVGIPRGVGAEIEKLFAEYSCEERGRGEYSVEKNGEDHPGHAPAE